MTALVPILHPPTGKILYMHPGLAAQTHRWVHPDPSVPTPAESLPLFDLDELGRLCARLATHPHLTPPAAAPSRKADAYAT